MGKQEGADAHGPAGSRTGRPHGGDKAWADRSEKTATDHNKDFDQTRADRDAGGRGKR